MSANKGAAGFQPAAVDRLIHEPARYGVMALLYVVRRAEFLFVQNQTGLTPGNLSAHVSKLEQAGYLKVDKKFVGRKPTTFLSLSNAGKKAFEEYRRQMKELFTKPPEAANPDTTEI